MKANRLVFENAIDVNPRTGIIKFNNKRMVLESVEALGFLRRDIVKTLGMERAKGFLLRYGWACGKNAGSAIESMYNWKGLHELMEAGAATHTLAGNVTVEIDELVISEDSFFMKGSWHNSYEAEQHVRYFDFSDKGVCWTLVGFVAGYIDKVYNKKVVVYEEGCKGKKDNHCTFVARTVEHATDEQVEILRYFQEESIVSELDRTYNELKSINNSILRSDKVHQKLTNCLLEGQSLNELITILSDELSCSVVIEMNKLNKPFANYFINEQDKYCYERFLFRKKLSSKEVINTYEIMAMQSVLGRIIVISKKTLSREQEMIIERSLSVFAIFINTQRQIAQSLWRKKAEFIDEIIDDKADTNKLIKKGKHLFDIDVEKNIRIAIIKSDSEIIESVHSFVENNYASIESFIKNDFVVLILSEKYLENKYMTTLFDGILQKLQVRFKNNTFLIAVGHHAETLQELGESYNEALLICNFLLNTLQTRSQYAIYENYQHIMLFLKTTEPKALNNFYESMLGKLIQYDLDNNSTLVYTLKMFLDNNGNVKKTAQLLNLSIPGFRYRMDKIESLVPGIKNGDGRFQCQLAIMVHYALKSLNK
ncbi:XylR N-terminal domain-containing protein [Rummeliibacillus pycnus]|uniref:XylR N-terminal domain-containing protein n=1 Tax=Rummeliibacillus pycnus TaxID=101070 RepID=UPI003D2843F8